MGAVALRNGVEIEKPFELALEFLRASSGYETYDSMPARSSRFDERDVRLANRGGARISAAEIAGILERGAEIEASLRRIRPDSSLVDATRSIPWVPLRQLFCAFADIRGVGFSKTTKALHRKRPALIPILDSVVQSYLTSVDPKATSAGTFGERATGLVRSYKHDVDRNRSALQELKRKLAKRDYHLSEVRILDLCIWSSHA